MVNIKYFLFIFILVPQLYSLDFKVASYNVENFFDLQYDKTEYKKYIPHTKTWNQTSYNKKLKNISKTIHDLDADILALQEIESKNVLKALLKKNPSYKYVVFHKKKDSAIGLALLSKFKITSKKVIVVNRFNKYSRDILKVTLDIDNQALIVYVNHWRSKRAAESKRIKYALALKRDIDAQENNDYIILGDLNSNYNEYQTFQYDKKLNDTYGITGINQILNTTLNKNLIHKNNILKHQQNVHFNTWLELDKKRRYSTKFKNNNNTPDNILLSANLFDEFNISYIDKSFNVFKPSYLFKNNKIYRWNSFTKNGFSDHLPIYAYFSTKKQNYTFKKTPTIPNKENTINYLYDIEHISNYTIKDVTVLYKAKDIVLIKQNNKDKAIMIYKPQKELKVGFSYDLTVDAIDEYNGLKEIKKISNISLKQENRDFQNLFLDGNTINLQDEKFLNNVIKNVTGIYKKRHLYFNNKKIRLYFKKGIKKPEEGNKVSISSGHLSIYKSSMQIVLHKEIDFKVF